MNYILTFVISFIIIYLIYFILVIKRKKGLESLKNGKQIKYLVEVYKLDLEKVNFKKLASSLVLTNSFILSLTLTILEFVDNYILKILLCFVILIPLIIIMYKILGETYKKKEGEKNV